MDFAALLDEEYESRGGDLEALHAVVTARKKKNSCVVQQQKWQHPEMGTLP